MLISMFGGQCCPDFSIKAVRFFRRVSPVCFIFFGRHIRAPFIVREVLSPAVSASSFGKPPTIDQQCHGAPNGFLVRAELPCEQPNAWAAKPRLVVDTIDKPPSDLDCHSSNPRIAHNSIEEFQSGVIGVLPGNDRIHWLSSNPALMRCEGDPLEGIRLRESARTDSRCKIRARLMALCC